MIAGKGVASIGILRFALARFVVKVRHDLQDAQDFFF